jgi:predicted O-linked N-acetylglucosamine transferase (SPINDLY family)/SAM-dependent methyltransferase
MPASSPELSGKAVKSAAEWHQEAVDLLDRGLHLEAIACFQSLISVYPDYQVAYNDLGVVCYSLGMKDEARVLLEKAVRLEPHKKNSLANLADVYAGLGLKEELLRVLRQMQGLDPEDKPLVAQIATLEEELGKRSTSTESASIVSSAPAHVRGPKFYISPSNVNYADGSEQTMLDYFEKNDVADEYLCWDPKIGWSPYYNLSPIRKNLFNWIHLGGANGDAQAGRAEPDAALAILELGAGCGAITSHLVTLPGASVVAVEGAIKRAEVTRTRCKHADNLEVHACNIDQFETEQRFDLVTLIGVLEYAGLYSKGAPEPFRRLLARVKRWLKPDGCLILAIENQLGHRYLAGMQEDHYHAAYQGINNYPDYNGIRTFDAAGIRALLNDADLSCQRWFYPFPDYKMPEIILSHEALSDRKAFDYLSLLELPTTDPSTKDRPLFNERAFLKAMASYGSVGHLMNSFLVLASGSADCAVLRDNASTVAAKLNVRRHRSFQHCVRFVREDDGTIAVVRSLLHGGAHPGGGVLQHRLDPPREAYVSGAQSVESGILDALTQGNVGEAARLVGIWEETLKRAAMSAVAEAPKLFEAFVDRYLQRKVYVGPQASWVPGECLDLHPGNILIAADGTTTIIDLEWRLECPLPVQLVFDYGLRKLLSVLAKSDAYLPGNLKMGARVGFPKALETHLPATSLYHSARLKDGDFFLKWFMTGVVSGDFTRPLPQTSPEAGASGEVARLLSSFAANPAEPAVLDGLRKVRAELADQILRTREPEVEAWLASQAGKAWASLRESPFVYEPLCPEDEKNADALTVRHSAEPTRMAILAALMLYRPAHDVGHLPTFNNFPAYFLEPYLKYLFAVPPLFRKVGEVERYTSHYDRSLGWLLAGLRKKGTPAVAAKCTTVFAQVANLIPIYFSGQNTKAIYAKRAELIEMALKQAGATLDFAWPTPKATGARIRVGFLNQHFGSQTETYSSLPTFEHLDRSKFEVVLFCPSVSNTPLEAYARGRADRFVHLTGPLPSQVETIRKEDLDVLLVGTNVTAVTNNIVLLATHRLARVQLITNSSPVTSGIRHADGYISGTMSSDPAEQSHFTEKLHLLDGPAHCFNYAVDATSPATRFTRQTLGIPAAAPVFISGANFFKIIPELQHTWATILADVPESRLVLHPFNPNWSSKYPVTQFVRLLREVLAEHGVKPDRLVVLTDVLPGRADAVEMMKLGDVYLDSFPFAGVNSTVDPLELGIPCVCWEADTFRSRMAGSLFRELGVDGMVATDERAYIQLAVRLATDEAFRSAKSREIGLAMARRPRFLDSVAYAQEMGKLLERVVRER